MLSRSLVALAALLILAPAVRAAEPATGTVSTASPRVEWAGESNGYLYFNFNRVMRTAGQQPRCDAPACDEFTLDVKDSADLTISATYEPTVFLDLDIVLPDGSFQYVDGGDDNNTTSAKIKKAPVGTYKVRVTTNGVIGTDGGYTAFAQLAVAPPAVPAPAVTVPPVPAPAPAPAARPAPKKPSAKAACQKKAKKIKNKRKRKAALKRCAKKKG